MIDKLRHLLRRFNRTAMKQEQREALLDLLIWTMYADNFLAFPENEEIESVAQEMDWTSVTPVRQYTATSIARIRQARAGRETFDSLLNDIYTRLGSDEMRTRAYEACQHLAQIDGQVAEEERQFLSAVQARFQHDERQE